MNEKDEIQSGWAYNHELGAICHFEHVPREFAEAKTQLIDEIYVVETINWTIADESKESVHFNQYFAYGLNEALAISIRLQLFSHDVAENTVKIRIATDEEADIFMKVDEEFEAGMPDAISDNDVRNL